MASARDFNDPFDCRIPQNFLLLSPAEKDKYISDQFIRLYPMVNKRTTDLEKKIHETERRFQDMETYQKEHDQIEFEYFDKYFGVLSLSCRWNSVLLWSHYAASHEGFCVGFFEERLRNSLLPYAAACGYVTYQDKFPEIKPKVYKDPNDPDIINRRFTETLTKSSDWIHEEEYRMFINYFPNIPDNSGRLIHFSNETIAEIIIGMKVNPLVRDEIIEICNSKKITVYQARKSSFNFEISKEIIK
jgi:hypothetical protein